MIGRLRLSTIDGFYDLANSQRRWLLVIAGMLGVLISQLPIIWSAGLLVGIAIILLGLVQPLFILALAVIVGPFGALENIVIGPSVIETGQLLFLIAVIGWLGRSVLRGSISLAWTPISLALTLFIAVAGITLLGAFSLGYGVKEVIKWLELGLAMVMVIDMLTVPVKLTDLSQPSGVTSKINPVNLRWVMLILFISGVIQAILGIWQFGLSDGGPEHFKVLDRFYRAFGTFQQPNPYGGYMSLIAVLSIGTLVGLVANRFKRATSNGRRRSGGWMWLIVVAATAILTSMGLLLSWSRGAWLGFAAALVLMILFIPHRRRNGVLFLSFAAGLMLLGIRLGWIPGSITERLSTISQDMVISDVRGVHITTENYAIVERLAHWQAGAEMAQDNLFLGVGFGNFEPAYENYALLNWPEPLGHAHNYYLNILAETGLVGTLAYLFFWSVVFVQLIKMLRKLEWPQRGIALGLLAAWTALSVHQMFDKLYVNNIYISMGVMLGLQQTLAVEDE